LGESPDLEGCVRPRAPAARARHALARFRRALVLSRAPTRPLGTRGRLQGRAAEAQQPHVPRSGAVWAACVPAVLLQRPRARRAARVTWTRAPPPFGRVAVVSTEAALVMTKATEHFIGWVTSKAMANKDVRERKKESLDYNDLPPLVAQHPEQLEFATDL
jgi:hypothetical protein